MIVNISTMEESIYPQTLKALKDQNLVVQEKPLHLFLKSHEILKERPYLYDLAQLEYQLYTSFITPQYEFKLDMDALLLDLEQTPQLVVLETSNSLSLLTSSYPIQEIWLDLREGNLISKSSLRPGEYYYVINSVAGSTGAFLVSKIIFNTLKMLNEKRCHLDYLVSKLFSHASPKELEEVLRQILKSGWIQNYQLKSLHINSTKSF